MGTAGLEATFMLLFLGAGLGFALYGVLYANGRRAWRNLAPSASAREDVRTSSIMLRMPRAPMRLCVGALAGLVSAGAATSLLALAVGFAQPALDLAMRQARRGHTGSAFMNALTAGMAPLALAWLTWVALVCGAALAASPRFLRWARVTAVLHAFLGACAFALVSSGPILYAVVFNRHHDTPLDASWVTRADAAAHVAALSMIVAGVALFVGVRGLGARIAATTAMRSGAMNDETRAAAPANDAVPPQRAV